MKAETRERLASVTTATVSMQLMKRGIDDIYMHGVQALTPGYPRLVGPAYTLRYVPSREDRKALEKLGDADNPARRAIEECPAGAVLVADARGKRHCGVIGDILVQRLLVRGVAGMVSDGGVRDAQSIADIGLPVFCAGPAAPASPTRHIPIDLQVPIACGDVAVFPGDIIVADRDGAVVIPETLADEIAVGAAEQEGIEGFIQKLVAAGRPVIGTYPPTDAIRAEFAKWLEAGQPAL